MYAHRSPRSPHPPFRKCIVISHTIPYITFRTSDNAMYSTSVITPANIPRFGKNQFIAPPPPSAPPLSSTTSLQHRLSWHRSPTVRVRTYLDLAMLISAVGNVGVTIPLQLLHPLYYDLLMFLDEVFTELRNCADISQDIWPCRGRSSHDRPHRSRYRIFVFFPRPLWSRARPCSTVAVHRRWYHGGFVDTEAFRGSSCSCLDISSSSLPVQRLLAAFY